MNTDTIDYVVTDQNGLTSTTARTARAAGNVALRDFSEALDRDQNP
jgi:hypothetical protein